MKELWYLAQAKNYSKSAFRETKCTKLRSCYSRNSIYIIKYCCLCTMHTLLRIECEILRRKLAILYSISIIIMILDLSKYQKHLIAVDSLRAGFLLMIFDVRIQLFSCETKLKLNFSSHPHVTFTMLYREQKKL